MGILDKILIKMENSPEIVENFNYSNLMCKQTGAPVMLNMEEGITFTWANLNVSTTPQEGKRLCGLLKSKPKPAKQILQNVSGVARPGEVLAISGGQVGQGSQPC
eukprot:TRINITY_DN32573_c0_g1_i1.p1 TRINITY_DN32573_c0_g1~~TRINITY_DN32573_c0_g1_i1.p1  ORF type:complete len:113 (-),score=29.72 TRINITY_DN32573_c0_g1_i1:95-409(-)